MAKTTKTVKKSDRKGKAAREASPKKNGNQARKTPVELLARYLPRPQVKNGTKARLVASLLPDAVENISYIQRTIAILDKGEKSRKRLRQQQRRELKAVLTDLQRDVSDQLTAVEQSAQERFEKLTGRVMSTRFMQTATEIPDRVTDTMDGWLGQMGLVRKSQHAAALKRARARARAH